MRHLRPQRLDLGLQSVAFGDQRPDGVGSYMHYEPVMGVSPRECITCLRSGIHVGQRPADARVEINLSLHFHYTSSSLSIALNKEPTSSWVMSFMSLGNRRTCTGISSRSSLANLMDFVKASGSRARYTTSNLPALIESLMVSVT